MLGFAYCFYLFTVLGFNSLPIVIVDFGSTHHYSVYLHIVSFFSLFPRVASGIHSFLPERLISDCSNEMIKQQHFLILGTFIFVSNEVRELNLGRREGWRIVFLDLI